MRTLDDFAFVKEAGFKNLYDSISETLDFYNKVPLRIYCEQYRNPLDEAILAIYSIANIKDAIVPKGLSGDNIGRLKRVLPESLFIESGGEKLLTTLNSICSRYHHQSGWPPEEEWNKDAERCYQLMVEISRWLITFKKDITLYLNDNGPILWKQVLAKKKEELQALPENNSVVHTFQPSFVDLFVSQLDSIGVYKITLEEDLAHYYNKMYELLSIVMADAVVDEKPTDVELTDAVKTIQILSKFYPSLGATTIAMLYDRIVHPILFAPNWSQDYLTKSDLSSVEKVSTDIIYKGLLCINTYAVCKVIGTLSCSQSQIESLQTAFKNRNEDSFINAFKKLNCDTSALIILASIMPFLIKSIYGASDNPNVLMEWVLAYGNMPDSIKKYKYLFDDPLTEDLNKKERLEKRKEQILGWSELLKQRLLSLYYSILGRKESDDWLTLFPFEKKYINDILENKDLQVAISQINESITKTANIEEDGIADNTTNSDSFDLSDSFFSGSFPRDSKNIDKHFNLDYDVEKCGGAKFAQLINTIASWGFIHSSDTEKQKLVYILSGRFKPNGYDGEGLEWIDSGYGYELLYVIKYITGNEKGKYEKARQLFHGPQWLGKGDFKDQADYADASFRRALNEIYPDVCVIKGHVETVREPIRESGGFHIPDSPAKP